MSKRLKIGLIGAGVFAQYHAQKLNHHPRVTFTGVVDQSGKRASDLARKYNVPHVSLVDLLGMSEAVVIASPASSHKPHSVQALEAGCHCLIEKPLATSAKEAAVIVQLAKSKNLTVQVGHQERMVFKAIGLMDVSERPLKIEAVRNSPYSIRGTDTSVTFDLMTHDIDLCTALMGGVADEVVGQAGRVRSVTADMAYGRLRYGDAVANLKASRVADKTERWMKLTYASGEVHIDFNKKTLTNSTSFALDANFADKAIAKDSLGAATDNFVRAILDGVQVLVGPDDGQIAVQTAERIDEGRVG